MNAILGIDIGTSGVKTLLISLQGEVLAAANEEYKLLTPHPNWAEQDPETWWQATIKTVRRCLIEKPGLSVAAIGLTGQMHGSVFLDRQGAVLRPAILWCDQRTGRQCLEITRIIGAETLIRLTGNRALTGFTAPKILWLRENEPHIYNQVRMILLPKDYIRYRLTGVFATEVSDASGTLLFNVAERDWSDEIIKALNIEKNLLPDCYESPQISGYLSREAANLLGIEEGTPVAGGGGDQAAGAVGNGVVSAGLASCVLGTSGVVFWHSNEALYDPAGRLHSFCHAIPGKWHLMAVTLAAGGSLRWFRDTLATDILKEAEAIGKDPYELIAKEAERVAPGSEGLLFLPYLAGERTPYADPNARGAFIGLSLRHNRRHLARAVLEGITMSIRDCFELGKECGLETGSVFISGGGARSKFWNQMVADMLGREIILPAADEGPAYGAAIIAGSGAGLLGPVEEAAASFLKISARYNPNPELKSLYDELYTLYQQLYRNLKGFYDESAAFVSEYTDS